MASGVVYFSYSVHRVTKVCDEQRSPFVNTNAQPFMLPDKGLAKRHQQVNPDADEPLGIPSESPARWIALGAAMAIQENGITSIDWFAMLRGWEMARNAIP